MVFAGNANYSLAKTIVETLGIRMGKAEVSKYSDGEVRVSINESVRGGDVFVIQSISAPVNDHLMELLLMIDAFKRASAGSITVVIPYFGYARQDRKAQARDPISAKLVADLLTVAGANRILTMDLHADQIQGFFNIPVDHLQGSIPLADYYKKYLRKNKISIDDIVVVAPDAGSAKRARRFAKRLGEIPIAIVEKRRLSPNVSEVMSIIGDVDGKICLIIDDIVDTGGSLCNAALALMEEGGKQVLACATHGVLSGSATENIANSCISELLVTNTIEVPKEKLGGKIKTLPVSAVFAEAIKRIYENLPVSTLFN